MMPDKFNYQKFTRMFFGESVTISTSLILHCTYDKTKNTFCMHWKYMSFTTC